MSSRWPRLPYEEWKATCDTLHGHTQVLGKLAAALAPPEPQLQHAALRLTARGWESLPLPAPDGSGAFAGALDLQRHEAVVEHTNRGQTRIPLAPNRSVAEVWRDVLAAVRTLAGPVELNPIPQETAWTTPLDQDTEHATYDPSQIADYMAAATRAALVLSEWRAPYRGRSTPVNAWWGGFDLAVSVFSGRPAEPPSRDFIMRNSMDVEDIAVGWWPGDFRYPRAAFYARARRRPLGREPRRVHPRLGRRDRRRRPAQNRARLRSLGRTARVRRLRVGPLPGCEPRGGPAPDRLGNDAELVERLA